MGGLSGWCEILHRFSELSSFLAFHPSLGSFRDLSSNWFHKQILKGTRPSSLAHFYQKYSDSSAGKESACNAGGPGLIPGSGRFPRRRDRLPTPVFLCFPGGSAGKESACNVGDLGAIPGLGRFPGEGKDYPLQYSGLENSMDLQRVGHD